MDLEEFNKKVKGKEALIWDFDGTIVKLNLDWVKLKQELLEKLEKSEEFKKKQTSPSSLSDILYELIRSGKKKEAFTIMNKHEKNSNYSVNHTITGCIKQNAKKYGMVIFSDNMKDTLIKILKDLDMLHLFEIIVSKEDVERLKPDTDGIKLICRRLKGKDKNKILLIGDSWKDEKVANNFKIDFFKIDPW